MFRVIFFLVLAQACLCSKQLYVVHLDGMLKGETPEVTHQINYGLLLDFLGSEDLVKESLLYSYKHGFTGFAARLSAQQAKKLNYVEGVISVSENKMLRLHTTESWTFLDGLAQGRHSEVPEESKLAENTIIGVLDTGIWPESKSFHDDGLGPIPKRWKGSCNGTLENCNRKIIGARFYHKGFEELAGPLSSFGKTYFLSARDEVGHGTHTASIAAGRYVKVNTGVAQGIARGGAPHARIAVYKVCWIFGLCTSADVLAGIDDAIGDGVDIISASLGFGAQTVPELFFENPLVVGSFHAMRHGVLLSASAGNDGPVMSSVSNIAPWILTVASTSIDRDFQSNIILSNRLQIKGLGLNLPHDSNTMWREIVTLSSSNTSTISVCDDDSITLLNSKLHGKIVVCLGQPEDLPLMKHFGVAGVVVVDDAQKNQVFHVVLPVTQIGTRESTFLLRYMQTTRNLTARILPTETITNSKPAPTVAWSSSRGPSIISPDIIKPDISAPGMNILAAFPPIAGLQDTLSLSENVHEGYNIMSGTSMACPHATAVAANLKARYPHWSTSAIKSAIMTTAHTSDNKGNPIQIYYSGTDATPFDMGSGNVNPAKAMDPGLIYDIQEKEYSRFICQLGALRDFDGKNCTNETDHKVYNLNYPSISISNLAMGVTTSVARRVTNVSPCKGRCIYKVTVEAPQDIEVKVVPDTLVFHSQYETNKFTVEFKPVKELSQDEYKFGSITWTDGVHSVRSPFALH